MIDRSHKLSLARQCRILSIPRSSYYYNPTPMTEHNLRLMRRIDEIFTESPEYGSRLLRDVLIREKFPKVNRKRIRRLMRIMGLEAVFPKKNTSKPGKGTGHKIYPYLLKGLEINRPNQVWCTDITYIRLSHGFVYLVAVMDWYSRKILSWELSITMDKDFCITALNRAIRRYGVPEIFNSDQGSQFTCEAFRHELESRGVKISMDGKGRALDNIMIERFWRTLKYGEVYLNDYENPILAYQGIERFIDKYNSKRPHSSLEKRTPDEAYRGENNFQREDKNRMSENQTKIS